MLKDYWILEAYSPEDLSITVNKHLEDGYCLCGGPFSTERLNRSGYHFYKPLDKNDSPETFNVG